MISQSYAKELARQVGELEAENERLRAEKIEQEQEWAAVCAERERPLRTEIERLKRELAVAKAAADANAKEIVKLASEVTSDLHADICAENDNLQAENERLRGHIYASNRPQPEEIERLHGELERLQQAYDQLRDRYIKEQP